MGSLRGELASATQRLDQLDLDNSELQHRLQGVEAAARQREAKLEAQLRQAQDREAEI
jgi:hypothetical protein